jgi:hypothetical protein
MMHEKLDIYDLLGVLVPGVLVVCSVPLAFPTVAHAFEAAKLPDAFAVVGLTAASIFAGFLIQAIASVLEGLLNWTWGGRPSERALQSGLGERYLPVATATRVKAKLVRLVGADADVRSLFLVAMRRAETCESSRADRFNALFACHRALFVMAVVALAAFLFSFRGGFAARITEGESVGVTVVLLAILGLCWYRTKQRGMYYVREVLLCAEQQIDAAGTTLPSAEK